MWDWLLTLYYISAIFLFVGWSWKVVILPLFAVTLIFNDKAQKVLAVIISMIPYYFLASYAALIGLGVAGNDRSILIYILGGLFLFFYGGSVASRAENEMERNNDYQNSYIIKAKYYATFISTAYYIYLLFDPRLAINKSTLWLYDAANWVQNIPVVGWIIGILAFLNLIYIIITGVGASLVMIVMPFVKRSEKKQLTEGLNE